MNQLSVRTFVTLAFLSVAACTTPEKVRQISSSTTSALTELNHALDEAKKASNQVNNSISTMVAGVQQDALLMKSLEDQSHRLDAALHGKAAVARKKQFDDLLAYIALKQREQEIRLEKVAARAKLIRADLKPLSIPKAQLQQVAEKLAELRKKEDGIEAMLSLFNYLIAVSNEIETLQKAAATQ